VRAVTLKRAPHLCAYAGGVSLVEALIAVLIVAIGLMGIASLILESLRNGHVALLQTQAVNLVSDMEERIRANPGAGNAYDCSAYPDGPSVRDCAPSGATSTGINCTSHELAEDDLAQWQRAVRLALPTSGTNSCEANVSYAAERASSEPSTYRVSVSWLQRGGLVPLTYRSDLLIAPTRAP
jgi:type IV pilus assembly protein PilV